MLLGVHLADGVDDGALLVDDVGGAQRAHRHLAVVLLLAPGFVGFEDAVLGVGDEVERQLVLGDELLVAGGAVAAHAEHLVAQREEALVVVSEVARLGRAARRTVLRVEVEHQLLPLEVTKFNDIPILVRALEFRRPGSNLQHSIVVFDFRFNAAKVRLFHDVEKINFAN